MRKREEIWPFRGTVMAVTFLGSKKFWTDKYFINGGVFWRFSDMVFKDPKVNSIWLVNLRFQIKMGEIINNGSFQEESYQPSFQYRILSS